MFYRPSQSHQEMGGLDPSRSEAIADKAIVDCAASSGLCVASKPAISRHLRRSPAAQSDCSQLKPHDASDIRGIRSTEPQETN